MQIEFTTRGLLSVFFRQIKVFLVICIFTIVSGLVYITITRPVYESKGVLLVKFGDTLGLSRSNNTIMLSQNDRTEIIQANMDILRSRSLILSVVNKIGIDALYPELSLSLTDKSSLEEAVLQRIIKSDLNVKSGLQSNLISIIFTHHNPEIASSFIQHLIDIFIIRQSEVYNPAQTNFLQQEIKQSAEKLEKSQKELRLFKAKTGITSIDDEIAQLLKQKSDTGTVSLESLDDSWNRLSELQGKELQLLATYREDSPQVKAVREQVEQARNHLSQRQADLASRTGSAAGNITKRLASLEAQRNKFNDLQRQVAIDEANYKNYLMRGEEARINEVLNKKNITPIVVVDNPVTPKKPSKPNIKMIFLISMLAGAVLGLGLALALETLDLRFTTLDQLATALNVLPMASFNELPKERIIDDY